jgi:hypothetical protein
VGEGPAEIWQRDFFFGWNLKMGIYFARFAAKRNRNGVFEAAGKRNETETRSLQLPCMEAAFQADSEKKK